MQPNVLILYLPYRLTFRESSNTSISVRSMASSDRSIIPGNVLVLLINIALCVSDKALRSKPIAVPRDRTQPHPKPTDKHHGPIPRSQTSYKQFAM